MTPFDCGLWDAVASRVNQLRTEGAQFENDPNSESFEYPFALMPFRASKSYFKTWEKQLRDEIQKSGIRADDVPILFAMAYYGPDELTASAEAWLEVRKFVNSWASQLPCNIDRWQRCDLVFGYALGLGRNVDGLADNSDWNGGWSVASQALAFFVMAREQQLKKVLHELGVFWDKPSLSANGYQRCRAILMDETHCSCVEEYLKRHPKAKREEVALRHERQHRLQAWWDLSGWPLRKRKKGDSESEQPKLDMFNPILNFTLRALDGEASTGNSNVRYNIRYLDKGLLFEILNPKPELFTTLACAETRSDSDKKRGICGEIIQDFHYCAKCRTSNPHFEISDYRLRNPGDSSWRETSARRCVSCSRFFEYSQVERDARETLCRSCREKEIELPPKKAANPVPSIWVKCQLAGQADLMTTHEDWEKHIPASDSVDSDSLHELEERQSKYEEFRSRVKSHGIQLPIYFRDFDLQPGDLSPEQLQVLKQDPFVKALSQKEI